MFKETKIDPCFFESKEDFLKTFQKNSIKLSKYKILEIKINGINNRIDYFKKKLKGFILDSFFGKEIIFEKTEGTYYILFNKDNNFPINELTDIKSKIEQAPNIQITIIEIPCKNFKETILES